MSRRVTPLVLLLAFYVSFTAGSAARDKAEPADPAKAREILGKFEKGDPGWKARMTGLVELARQGPGTVPVLLEGLKSASPSAREFAAQALVLFADASCRPALEQAVADPIAGVRLHAILALSNLGPLPRTEKHLQMLAGDPNKWGVRAAMAAALERNDQPNPAALRKALADYDLSKMDTARVGHTAPDFTLSDYAGKTYRLSEFRGKQAVVVRFILFDY